MKHSLKHPQTIGKTAIARKTALAAALGIFAAPTMAQMVLEEVIVTAQKRAESVQDVNATVNVVSGENIERFNAFDFSEIESQTAGLTLSSPNARNNTISLRGVSVDPEAGNAAAVDVYWNDAIVRADVAFTQLYDLARIEILRGPQGTLQGRTSPAGAINIITQGASLDEPSGYVSVSASDNAGINTQAAYGAPLIEDTLAVRVAAVYDTNAGADVENITTGLDDQELEAKSARFSALWDITESLSAQLIYQYLDQSKDDPKGLTGVDALNQRPSLQPSDRTALAPSNDTADLEFDVANLIVDWEFMEHSVTGIIGYQDSLKEAKTENDRANSMALLETPIPTPTFQTSATDTESISYELRIASPDNDFWDYMIGLYYQDQNTSTEFAANSVRLENQLGFRTVGNLPVNRNNYAIFTFNSFTLTDDLELEFGLRWTNYDSFVRADVFFDQLNYLPPSLEPIADVVEAGFAANFPINAVDNADSQEDAVTGSLTLRWDWTDEIATYVSYNRGYRPGGISIIPSPNVEFLPNGQDDIMYSEEESDAFEIGFKSRLLDGQATLNGALYYQSFDGYQGFVRGVQVLSDDGAAEDLPGGIVYNGDANIWGVELEGQILLTETWSAGSALSYTKGEWDGATQPCNDRAPGEVIGECDIDGQALGGEPEWSFSLNSEYYIPLDSTEVYFRGLFKYTDDRLNIDASAGLGIVAADFDAYQTLDLFAGWRSADYTWDVSVWGKNVFDEDEVIFQQGPDSLDVAISDGSYTQTNVLRERTIGITGRYNF
jgi:outer membrane receptor protein involved in Fe transport